VHAPVRHARDKRLILESKGDMRAGSFRSRVRTLGFGSPRNRHGAETVAPGGFRRQLWRPA